MTAEDHRELTKRDDHDRVVASVRAIIEACNEPGKVALAFRLLRWRNKDEVVAWARDLFRGHARDDPVQQLGRCLRRRSAAAA